MWRSHTFNLLNSPVLLALLASSICPAPAGAQARFPEVSEAGHASAAITVDTPDIVDYRFRITG